MRLFEPRIYVWFCYNTGWKKERARCDPNGNWYVVKYSNTFFLQPGGHTDFGCRWKPYNHDLKSLFKKESN